MLSKELQSGVYELKVSFLIKVDALYDLLRRRLQKKLRKDAFLSFESSSLRAVSIVYPFSDCKDTYKE